MLCDNANVVIGTIWPIELSIVVVAVAAATVVAVAVGADCCCDTVTDTGDDKTLVACG